MEMEQDHSFLGPITSLCCHLTTGPNPGVTPAITTQQLKRIRANALRNILFPDAKQNGKLFRSKQLQLGLKLLQCAVFVTMTGAMS